MYINANVLCVSSAPPIFKTLYESTMYSTCTCTLYYMYMHVHTMYMYIQYIITYVIYCTCICIYTCTSEFLIGSYGAPLAQSASYLALHSSHVGPDGTVNYDYIITSSINSLLHVHVIGSRCIPNGAHPRANLAHASKLIENSDVHVQCKCTMYYYV